MIVVNRDFKDWDRVLIKAGTKADRIEKMGRQLRSGEDFYNLISDGKVVAVILGVPDEGLLSEVENA